jgi:hypothetical protein
MLKQNVGDRDLVTKMIENAEIEEKHYFKEGKEFYSKLLHDKQMLFEAEFVLKEVNKLFSEEIEKLPKELSSIIKRFEY